MTGIPTPTVRFRVWTLLIRGVILVAGANSNLNEAANLKLPLHANTRSGSQQAPERGCAFFRFAFAYCPEEHVPMPAHVPRPVAVLSSDRLRPGSERKG